MAVQGVLHGAHHRGLQEAPADAPRLRLVGALRRTSGGQWVSAAASLTVEGALKQQGVHGSPLQLHCFLRVHAKVHAAVATEGGRCGGEAALARWEVQCSLSECACVV